LSGGIDSPVAVYLLAREHEVYLLNMDNRPFADEEEWKNVRELAKRLREVTGKPLPLYSSSHGPAQGEFKDRCTARYQCILCKRMMFRTAEMLARRLGAGAIGTGDSLGQVASQTLQNMAVVEEAISIPVLRPLVGLDKTEIIEIARRIGTYEISILQSTGCTLAPDKPAVKAELKLIRAEENKLDMERIVRDAEEGLEEIGGEGGGRETEGATEAKEGVKVTKEKEGGER
ncbi:MAG: hypothetical protein KAT70_00390, partial [Thermoplasmata archaeon]|nr:hypothetical protein [Thermoplasmata archaeon]